MNDMYKTKSIVGARLVEYITHKGMSINSFEIEWGVSKNYIKNIVRNIKPEYLESLIEKWPDINLNWLMMGKGNMLNESKSDSDIPGMSLPQMPEVPKIPVNQEGNNAIFEALIKTLNVQKDAFDIVVNNLKNQLEDERKFRNEKMDELERHILNQSSQINSLIEKMNLITKDKNGKKAS